MSAYSDYKVGAITEEEYKKECARMNARERREKAHEEDEEIKRCPFCGRLGSLFYREDPEACGGAIFCDPSDNGCGAWGPGAIDEEEATEKWNKRAQEEPMTELEKLEKYLKEKRYRYERIKETPGTNPWARGYEKDLIIVYNENGERQWDAICHRGSYGFEQGLLEIMGSIVKPGGDSVEGWLTSADIIERLEEKT